MGLHSIHNGAVKGPVESLASLDHSKLLVETSHLLVLGRYRYTVRASLNWHGACCNGYACALGVWWSGHDMVASHVSQRMPCTCSRGLS